MPEVLVKYDTDLPLTERTTLVAVSLRTCLEPIVRSVAGGGGRPSTLCRELAIDKTLAARLVRGIRTSDPFSFLGEIPSPQGLRIFLDAAGRAGVDVALCDEAARSIRQFENLIDEFPGGRTALSAAIADRSSGRGEKGERAAKQSIYKAMSYLLGYHTEVSLVTSIICPASHGRMCDQVTILGKYGLRRLRASAPITVFGRRADEAESSDGDASRVESLDGISDPTDAASYLLGDYCSTPAPPLSLFKAERVYLYTLGENTPAVNSPVSLTSAQVIRNGHHRWRSAAHRHQWLSMIPRIPSRVLIVDLFVHDDAYPGVTPVLTTTMAGLATGAARPDLPAFQLDRMDLSTPLQMLGRGLASVATRDLADYDGMLEGVFRRMGWDAARFRGYRCRIQYPVPMVSVTQWIELPERPGGPLAG